MLPALCFAAGARRLTRLSELGECLQNGFACWVFYHEADRCCLSCVACFKACVLRAVSAWRARSLLRERTSLFTFVTDTVVVRRANYTGAGWHGHITRRRKRWRARPRIVAIMLGLGSLKTVLKWRGVHTMRAVLCYNAASLLQNAQCEPIHQKSSSAAEAAW